MKNNGYKVCYKECGTKSYIRHFKTYTKLEALDMICHYIRYPPKERETARALIKPKWKIIKVSKREILAGIWDEPPF